MTRDLALLESYRLVETGNHRDDLLSKEEMLILLDALGEFLYETRKAVSRPEAPMRTAIRIGEHAFDALRVAAYRMKGAATPKPCANRLTWLAGLPRLL